MENKRLFVLLCLMFFVLGTAVGWYIEYYYAVKLPRERFQALAQKSMQEIRQDTRDGTVEAISPDSITIAVKAGGGDIGKTMSYNLGAYTQVQETDKMVSVLKKPDLAALGIKKGYWVNMLVSRNGNVLKLQYQPNGEKSVVEVVY